MAGVKVLTVGEALVDWVSKEPVAGLAQARTFTRAPGGAPLNVAVGLARLGVSVGFAGCLADDAFGDELAALLAAEGVVDRWTRRVAGRQTRMAYVTTGEDGDRHLAAFSRVACADTELGEQDLPVSLLSQLEAFYFGSLALAGTPARPAILEAAARVRASGGLVVFDPNVRPVLWSEAAKLARVLRAAMELAQVVKLGADELMALTGTPDLVPGADRLMAVHPVEAVLVTDGSRGAGVRLRGGLTVELPAFGLPVVDPTGAGDGFVAGVLAGLVEACAPGERLAGLLQRLDEGGWRQVLRNANAVGGLATTGWGAIAALPRRAELDAFMRVAAGQGHPSQPG